MYNPYSLEGKVILVTGASAGIGRVTAVECSKLGATVIITARDKDRLEETFQVLEGKDRMHRLICADLCQESEIEKLVSELPLLDGCVSNAGIGKTLPIQFFSFEELDKIYRVNSFAPMLLTKFLVKKKKMKKQSSIVFISSVRGFLNFSPGNGAYGTSKNAINAFMKYAALELAGKGIRCNAINPAMIKTQLIENKIFSEKDIMSDLEKYPLKRYGESVEVAYAVIYLLSDATAWVTGTNIVIDGGRTLK